MRTLLRQLRKLFLLKAKFALTSGVATMVDYVLYLLLVNRLFSPVVSNVISYSIAVVLNFLLQKRFIFSLKRSVSGAFIGAMLVSVGGLFLSTAIIYFLNRFEFFDHRQYLTKLCATAMVFFYNFYCKRYVFEKRFFSVD